MLGWSKEQQQQLNNNTMIEFCLQIMNMLYFQKMISLTVKNNKQSIMHINLAKSQFLTEKKKIQFLTEETEL